MRPVFVGNLDYDTRHAELDHLFYRYGRIERIDMKSGFAFIYFEDERDGDDAIRALDGYPFGPGRRRISVEWSRGHRAARRDGEKPAANTKPTKTLFVINFDPINTRVGDIERHFGPFGNISNVRIRRNFAFVQFETQEEARKALEATHATTLLDRVISVEYAFRDDNERSDKYETLEEEVAMVGVGIARIAVLSAQCTGHDLVLTMVAHLVLSMVRIAEAEVLFVIAIGDLLVTDQDPRLPTEEHATNSELC